MSDDTTDLRNNYIDISVNIVSAYVSNNHVAPLDLPALIRGVHAIISAAASGGSADMAAELVIEKPTAAQIRKSVRRDGIVSFIDGRSYKTMRRHLTSHGLTPQSYRERYGLPRDYPMTAASYSEQRSSLAKQIGLGVPRARSAA